MNPMESASAAENPKEKAPTRPETETPVHASEPALEASPEEVARLEALEAKLDGLREEMRILLDARDKDSDIRRQSRLFNREDHPPAPGLLSREQAEDIRSAFEAASSQYYDLARQRDDLEEQILDLEILRERKKARASDEYLQTLKASGRHDPFLEHMAHLEDQNTRERIVDQRIEYLKKKRNSN